MLILRQLLFQIRRHSLCLRKSKNMIDLVKSQHNVREYIGLTDSVYLTVPSSEILPQNKT